MSTNDPSDPDPRPQRVQVRRVGEPVKPRFPWRLWLLLGGFALAALAVIVLVLGVLFVLLPYILLVIAALMVIGWLRAVLSGTRR